MDSPPGLYETATAQYKSEKRDVGNYGGGDCPIGTCAVNGGSKAKDIKFCKASNCRKQKNKVVSRWAQKASLALWVGRCF